jgi:hypothetical protein
MNIRPLSSLSSIFTSSLATLCFACTLSAQTPQLTTNQLNGFRHVFASIGAPTVTQADSDRRLQNFGLQLGLTDTETQFLGSLGSQFRQFLATFPQPSSEQEAIQQVETRDSQIRLLASSCLTFVSQKTQARILSLFEDPSKVLP